MIEESAFLDLLDQVLVDLGRDPLPAQGPEQRIISVRSTDRVLQILAGPGSGKTEMLVWRVLYELFVMDTPSHKIMVTTFTRRAATELQVRVVERSDALIRVARDHGQQLPDPKVHDMRVGTIHSLCDSLLTEFDTAYVESGSQVIGETEIGVRIARDHRFRLGYSNPPAPRRVLNRLFSSPALTALFRPAWNDNPNWPFSTMERVACILAIINQHTETWIPRCGFTGNLNGVEKVHGPKGLTDDLVKLQQRWEEYLVQNNIYDFATIQKRFLESQDNIATNLSHIFVDEFQDNNPIQFSLHTGWLKHPGVRLTVVGDDDQAIYRFRGSDIECFSDLAPFCSDANLPYRVEKLETNYRSTENIVDFTQSFRNKTVLGSLSMPKSVVASTGAPLGAPVRLLEGPWSDLCGCVAEELAGLGAGTIPEPGQEAPPSAAILMFSTSERSSRDHTAPALTLRRALESNGTRTYNPRNKMAASVESPVAQLLGLISYLIDPVSFAPVGKGGRNVMVAASMNDAGKKAFALSTAPDFAVSEAHLDFQKKFMKSDGGAIGAPSAIRQPVVQFVDTIRANLVATSTSGRRPRLTLSGFVSRLLALPYFRNSGFSLNLFRQALFTELLEANIAPSRLTMKSLDMPLEVQTASGKHEWPDQFWTMLSIFGSYLKDAPLDDPEIESFEEDAVLMLTFHQSKGLEFDHVYVAGTGREPDLGPALRTRLFSGKTPNYKVNGGLQTNDQSITDLALADRDREVYVAMTRAMGCLTVLHDPQAEWGYMSTNPVITALFDGIKATPHPLTDSVSVKEFSPNG